MLYDSPTGGLDPVTAHTINTLIVKLRDVQHVSSIVVTQRLQDAIMFSSFMFSAERQGLLPVPAEDGQRTSAGLTNILVLRDGTIFFRGSRQELLRSEDPYLKKFITE